MTRPATMRLHHDDNVLVALEPLASGSIAAGITAAERIPRGHKMASTAIAPGAPIHKFGQIIGFAGHAIAPGAWVHEHNVTLHEFDRDYQVESQPTAVVEPAASFQGFRRANGRAGTRNYIAILSSVNCAATVARQIVRQAEKTGLLDAYPNIDGIVPLTHGTGCGMAANGEGFETLERTLWGTACNPNIAAVLFVGLGCEVFQIARMKSAYGIAEGDAFRSMTIQESGGTPAKRLYFFNRLGQFFFRPGRHRHVRAGPGQGHGHSLAETAPASGHQGYLSLQRELVQHVYLPPSILELISLFIKVDDVVDCRQPRVNQYVAAFHGVPRHSRNLIPVYAHLAEPARDAHIVV